MPKYFRFLKNNNNRKYLKLLFCNIYKLHNSYFVTFGFVVHFRFWDFWYIFLDNRRAAIYTLLEYSSNQCMNQFELEPVQPIEACSQFASIETQSASAPSERYGRGRDDSASPTPASNERHKRHVRDKYIHIYFYHIYIYIFISYIYIYTRILAPPKAGHQKSHKTLIILKSIF